jgi:hypothetical protein
MSTTYSQRIKSSVIALSAISAVVALPVISSAASDTAGTIINASVGSTISITTGSPIAISLTPTAGGVVTSASDTVTVNTNNALGYNLGVNDADATTSLVSGANTFTASSGTKAAPATLANNTWGFAVATGTTGIGTNGFDASYTTENNNASSTSKWAGMPASGSPMALKSTSGVATNDATTVWYAAKANSSQPNGTYTDTVTYTATTN